MCNWHHFYLCTKEHKHWHGMLFVAPACLLGFLLVYQWFTLHVCRKASLPSVLIVPECDWLDDTMDSSR